MLQHIKNWWLNNALLIAIGVSIIIIILSLISTSVIPSTKIKISDKFLHSVAYFGLMWSWLMVLRNKKSNNPKLLLIISLTVFGIILEVLQGKLGVHRTPDWKDIIANIIGLGFGMFTFKPLFRLLFR
jgi:VanZ family protein